MKERTMVNIYQCALERSITGTIISMIRFMSEEEPLTFVGANIYRLTKELAEDFCKTLEPSEEQTRFKQSILNENFDKNKYKIRRIFNLVISGEDAVLKIKNLVGNIKERNGVTILGKFGFYCKEIFEFPVSCPSSIDAAKAQIDLFWNKYKHLGGIAKEAINYPNKHNVEETVVIIKPNAFEKPYDPRIGDVIDILSKTGMFIIASKIQIPTREQMEEFYAPHKGKPFFNGLIDFMSGRRSLALLYEGVNARQMIRKTAMTIIRDNYSENILENTIHTSENEEDFVREKNAIDFDRNFLL